MKKLLTLILLLLPFSALQAQDSKIDSLMSLLPVVKDTVKAEVLRNLMYAYQRNNLDFAIRYVHILVAYGYEIDEPYYAMVAHNVAGVEYFRAREYDSAVLYFKYAYTNKMGEALFSLKLEEHEGQYEMTVSDNGSGISDETLNATQSSSLGLRLTRMLSDQLEGEYAFDNSEGTCFKLKFAI